MFSIEITMNILNDISQKIVRLLIYGMNVEEKAILLIDNAMIRMKNAIDDDIESKFLQTVYNEQNLLRKIENLIHVIVMTNQKRDKTFRDMYDYIKENIPNSPSDPQILANWLLSYLRFQEKTIQGFHIQLNQIQAFIRDISTKINSSSLANKHNDLMEENQKLKKRINELAENETTINDLQSKLQDCQKERDESITENNKLKLQISSLQNANQSIELFKTKIRDDQVKAETNFSTVQQTLQFQIDTLKEKCLIMRQDLNFSLKQNIELNLTISLLKDEIEQKNAEIKSLKSIIQDYKSTNL